MEVSYRVEDMACKGERLSKAQRKKLSRLAIERYKRVRGEEAQGEPTHKRCNKCGELKTLEDFYWFKRKLASGEVTRYPQSRCKECDVEVRKRNWERLRAEGVDLAALKRRYEANEDQSRRRQRWRENQAILRRKQGRRAKERPAALPRRGETLPLKPIVELLESKLDLDVENANQFASKGLAALGEQSGISQRRIWGILHGEYKRVSLSTVDKLLHGLGLQHMLPILYPEEV